MVLRSPYRQVVTPILKYVQELSRKNPNRLICVFIPEEVEQHWYYFLLHNQCAAALKVMLHIKATAGFP